MNSDEVRPIVTGNLFRGGAKLVVGQEVIASYGVIISAYHKWTRRKLRRCLEPVMCLTSQALCNSPNIDVAILTNFANRIAFLILLEEGVFLMCSNPDARQLIAASRVVFEQCRNRTLDANFIRAVQTITAIATNESTCCLRADSHMRTLATIFNRARNHDLLGFDEEVHAFIDSTKDDWFESQTHYYWNTLLSPRDTLKFLKDIFSPQVIIPSRHRQVIDLMRRLPSYSIWKKLYAIFNKYRLNTYNDQQNGLFFWEVFYLRHFSGGFLAIQSLQIPSI